MRSESRNGFPLDVNEYHAPGQACLEPAWMDRLYTSMHWFQDEPWTRSSQVQERPYEHLKSELHWEYLAAGNEDLIPDFHGEPEAEERILQWAKEVENAWNDAQHLTTSGFNVNLITTYLGFFTATERCDIVNASWARVFEVAPSRSSGPSSQNGPYQVDYDGVFDKTSRPASVRNIDVREYLRVFRDSYVDPVQIYENSAPSDADPNINPGPHRIYQLDIDRTVFQNESLPDRKEYPRLFMLPFLNLEDLGDLQLLRCLVLNRILNHPREFARADWEGCHLGSATKICQGPHCDNWFMGFPTEQERSSAVTGPSCKIYSNYPVVYKNPTKADVDSALFRSLRRTGRIYSYGEGLTVLAVQAFTLRLVTSLAQEVARRVERTRADGLSLNGHELSRRLGIWKAHTWQKIPPEMMVFDVEETGLVAHRQFFPPSASASSWDEEYEAAFEGRLKSAKEYLRVLWHDPLFFQQNIRTQFRQHYGHITEPYWLGPDGRLPHIRNTDIDAKKALVNDLIRRVVKRTVFQVEIWQCLIDKLNNLRDTAREHGVSLDDRQGSLHLRGDVREAWVDLGYHARWFLASKIDDLVCQGGVLASHSIRDHFQRKTTWAEMKSQVPGDEWTLPRCVHDQINISESWHLGEDGEIKSPFRLDDHDHTDSFDDILASTVSMLLIGLKDAYTMGCIGVPKLIQAMHTDQAQNHRILGVQPMVSDDYKVIFWCGLLSQRMEAIQPFSEDLANPSNREHRQALSPIWPFISQYHDFPFEVHVDEKTLRMIHWSLGITYHPYSTIDQRRPAGLVLQWLTDFWKDISRWLSEPGTTPAENDSGGQSGLAPGIDDDSRVINGLEDSLQALEEMHIDNVHANTPTDAAEASETIIDGRETSIAWTTLARFEKAHAMSGVQVGQDQIEYVIDFASKNLGAFIPDDIDCDLYKADDIIAAATSLFRQILLQNVRERHHTGTSLKSFRQHGQKEVQAANSKRTRKRQRKGISTQPRQCPKSRIEKTTKKKDAKVRPEALLRHLDHLEKVGCSAVNDDYHVVRICGAITTLAPESYQEPTDVFKPAPGSRRRPTCASHTKDKTVVLAWEQMTYEDEIVDLVEHYDIEQSQKNTHVALKKKDWQVIDILLGGVQGEVSHKEFFDLCCHLGFKFQNRGGSRLALQWCSDCLFERPANATTFVFHPRHGGITRRVDNDQVGSFKRLFVESWNLTTEKIEQLYGPR